MNLTWTVRGVGKESQQRAKIAAAARGMAIGRWLENAIERCAGDEEEDRNRARHEAKKNRGKGGAVVVPQGGSPLLEVGGQRTVFTHDVGPSSADLDATAEESHAKEATEPVMTRELLRKTFGPPGKKARKAPKVCVHGTMKGNNCWQCGGLAAVQ